MPVNPFFAAELLLMPPSTALGLSSPEGVRFSVYRIGLTPILSAGLAPVKRTF
jgi:hypothetical protein